MADTRALHKPADTIINVFSDERLPLHDMQWLASMVVLHSYPSTVMDKIEAFAYAIIEKRKVLGDYE